MLAARLARMMGRYMPGFEPFSYGYYPPNLPDRGQKVDEGDVLIRIQPRHPDIPRGEASDHGLVAAPLIIPPVMNKTYDLFGELFSSLWQRAEKVLTDARRIVIIGYSLPSSDLRSLELFRSAFSKREEMVDLVLVNPEADSVYSRLSNVLPKGAARCRLVKEPFTATTNIRSLLDDPL